MILKDFWLFHSVSQIGYIVSAFGVAIICTGKIQDLAMAGALYHMINHAVFKGLLFLCAGAVLYTTGTTGLNSISGLGKKAFYHDYVLFWSSSYQWNTSF